MAYRKGSKGAVLNVKASKLPLVLSLEKFEHLYFSSHSKVPSPNLFIRKFHTNASKGLANVPLRRPTGLALPLTNGNGGGRIQFYTNQQPHIPHLAQPGMSI